MSTPLRIVAAGIIALVVVIGAWSFSDRSSAESERREAIAGKTQAERDQLQRRLIEFDQLSEAEQSEIRRLHKAVQEDAGLAQTLANYEAFVSRLDPLDQQELQSGEDVDARLADVRRIISEKERTDRPGRPSWLSGRFVEGPVLSPAKFNQAIELLITAVSPSQSELQKIEDSPTPEERHLAAIELAYRKRGNDRDRPWLDRESTKEVIDLLSEGRFRDWLLSDTLTDDFKAAIIPSLLTRSLLAEWQSIAPEVIPERQMQLALESISERDQSDWARHDPGRLQREMMKELERQEGPAGEFARKFSRVVALRNEIDPFARDRRRSFGRPPFGGPDRDDDRRGRPDGRPPFGGPDRGDERRGHLDGPPPSGGPRRGPGDFGPDGRQGGPSRD